MVMGMRVLVLAGVFVLGTRGGAAQAVLGEVTWIQALGVLRAYSPTGDLMADVQNVPPGGNYGLAVDGWRRVWISIAAPGSASVACFDARGNWVGNYLAGPPPNPNGFSVGPIAIDRQNFVYVGDPQYSPSAANFGGTGKITKLDPNGQIVAQFAATSAGVRALSIDGNGDLWITFYGGRYGIGHRVEKRSPNGTLLATVNLGLAYPNNVVADEWARASIAHHPTSHSISTVGLNGALVATATSTIATHFGALAVGQDGSFWSNNEKLQRLTSGEFSSQPLPKSAFATGIVVDSLRGAFYSCHDDTLNGTAPSIVLRSYSEAGAIRFERVIGPSYGYYGPFNIGDANGMHRARVVDPDGDLDLDGFANFQEVALGSSPLDPTSVPQTPLIVSPFLRGQIGRLRVRLPGERGRRYAMPFSLGIASIPIAAGDPRRFPIQPFIPGTAMLDPVFELSVGPTPFTSQLYPDTFGTLDLTGSATVQVSIPDLPFLAGITLHSAMMALHPGEPAGIGSIVGPISITIP